MTICIDVYTVILSVCHSFAFTPPLKDDNGQVVGVVYMALPNELSSFYLRKEWIEYARAFFDCYLTKMFVFCSLQQSYESLVLKYQDFFFHVRCKSCFHTDTERNGVIRKLFTLLLEGHHAGDNSRFQTLCFHSKEVQF